jgi:hypothetical protein
VIRDTYANSTNLDTKVVYRRYASLFFVAGIDADDNELITLEIIHRFVEVLDKYFGNVSGGRCVQCAILMGAHPLIHRASLVML